MSFSTSTLPTRGWGLGDERNECVAYLPEAGYTPNYHLKEEQLLAAVEEGNLERVKQLLTSGVGLNTVLHSKARRESATILGTAAYKGQVEIIQYLVHCNVFINYQDPCLCRNALHWACIGGSDDVVQILIRHKIDINRQDRDNVTPFIRAAMYGHKEIIATLIHNGADVTLCDRLHSTAIHYASFHGKPEVVTLLIRAGCTPNHPAIFGQGTPLANLVYHGDVENCRLLLEAGYDLRHDQWILQYDFSRQLDHDTNLGAYLLAEYKNPISLHRLCRRVIRHNLQGILVQKKLALLPVPNILRKYLLLEIP